MNLVNDVFWVIVLYKCRLEKSRTINSLRKNLFFTSDLFVFDNSPQPLYSTPFFNFDKLIVTYKSDTSSPGLSEAYNQALNEASLKGKKWMLLLDQDTLITKDFIEEITNLNTECLDESVAAIIPRVKSYTNKESKISPAKMFLGGFVRPVSIKTGVSIEPISGINSGTILKVDFINSISGFNNNFKLDMLDHWYFREIYKAKKRVFVLNSIIYQSLSVASHFEQNVTIERYGNMLTAEYRFVRSLGKINSLIFKLRLFYRLLKQIKFRNFEYFKKTSHFLFK